MICIKVMYGFTLNKYYDIIKHDPSYLTYINDYGNFIYIAINSSYFITIEEYRNNQIDRII